VELENGDVFINARGIGSQRISFVSHDGGLTYSSGSLLPLTSAFMGCEGSTVLHSNLTGQNNLYYSGLFDSGIIRNNLTMHRSYDNGQTWEAYFTIFNGATAYSSLSGLKNGTLGLLYEWAKEEKLVFDPDFFSFTIVPV